MFLFYKKSKSVFLNVIVGYYSNFFLYHLTSDSILTAYSDHLLNNTSK